MDVEGENVGNHIFALGGWRMIESRSVENGAYVIEDPIIYSTGVEGQLY